MELRRTKILIPVPEAEGIVAEIRSKYDPVSSRGIPAHITLLVPFIPPDAFRPEDEDKLKSLFQINKFEYSLVKVNTFSKNVVYLEPDEGELFINLTKKIYEAFPGYPPFQGTFSPEINPHLTIGQDLGDRFDECLKESKKLEDKLPLKCIAAQILIMTSDQGNWSVKETFELL